MITDYAKAHLMLIDIDRRFEALIANHPKRKTFEMRVRLITARSEARCQRNNIEFSLIMADHALR